MRGLPFFFKSAVHSKEASRAVLKTLPSRFIGKIVAKVNQIFPSRCESITMITYYDKVRTQLKGRRVTKMHANAFSGPVCTQKPPKISIFQLKIQDYCP